MRHAIEKIKLTIQVACGKVDSIRDLQTKERLGHVDTICEEAFKDIRGYLSEWLEVAKQDAVDAAVLAAEEAAQSDPKRNGTHHEVKPTGRK